MKNPPSALLFFVKYPEPGKVKTRLARSVGDKRAAQMYQSLVETNLRVLTPLHRRTMDCWIMFDPADKEVEIKKWLSDQYFYRAQEGKDLTERLTDAFKKSFEAGYSSVIALGSDTLKLRADIIEKAFKELENFDAVIGPAKDGGYYLIGLKKLIPEIFQGIPWSTSTVLTETLNRMRRLKLKYSLLQELEDLDEIKEYESI